MNLKNSAPIIALFLMALIGAGCASTTAPKPMTVSLDDPVRLALQERLTQKGRYDYSLLVQGESLYSPNLIRIFYQRRNYQPAWSHKRKPNRAAQDLIQSLQNADQEGLNPETYHVRAIKAARDAVDRELLLTDAYLIYSTHLAGMRGDPRIKKLMWQRNGNKHDALSMLEQGLASRNFKHHLQGLVTDEPGYKRLKAALAHYRKIASQGAWPRVSPGAKMQLGDQGPRVEQLHQRLRATGDIQQVQSVFDGQTDAAVRNFQRRHGLAIDGKVSRNTLAALNVPVHERLNQIKVNMHRRRWLPDQMGRRHIVVNIPAYRLNFVEHDRPILAMNVVVGQRVKTWRTPPLTSSVTHMILNPQWNVPSSIFKKELLKKIKKDPSYLSRHNMKVVKAKSVIPADTIDWETIKGNEGIRIVQRSGRGNALGTMKFMFPNPFAIYMHDTRAKSLFKRHRRAFSHGCIRVAQPLDLAEELFRESPRWSRNKITSGIRSGVRQSVQLPEPVNVYIQYWTAWADENGDTQFRNDIYDRDSSILASLGI